MTSTETPRTRGRPPAASREDVLNAAMYRYLRGRRVDVREIAAELGLGRTTIYRWFGSREGLIGEVLAQAGEPLLYEARAEAKGTGGTLSSRRSTASTGSSSTLQRCSASSSRSAMRRSAS